MATLYLTKHFNVTIDGVTYSGGSMATPQRITVTDPKLDLTKSLATATTWDVWASGDEEPISDFDFLWILSDKNVFVEITVDKGADVGTVVCAFEIKANVPFDMASDTAKANYTVDFAAGSDDVIDQIRIRNESGSTANIRVFAAT